MKTITVEKPWTYRSPQTTIDYGVGDYEVTDAIAAAYEAEHSKEKADGDGAPTPGPARAARKA